MTIRTTPNLKEATRLTRAGRLQEAMAVLRGLAPQKPDAGGAQPLDLVADAAGVWRAPQGGAETHASAAEPKARPAIAERLRGLFAGLDAAPAPGGLGGAGLAAKFGGAAGFGGMAKAHAPPPVPAGASFETLSFSNEAGSRSYKLYVPSRRPTTPMPLVVMLHGCTQSPDDFAAGTRMNALAEEQGFLVAYPGQTQAANAQKCWNWFSPADQRRGGGEPALIAGLTRQIMSGHRVDPARVFIAGLSAGGAAAAILGAAYPELYAAIGVHSGLACGAAHDMPSAFAAMRNGGPVRRADGRPIPTIVFHGDADHTVSDINGSQVITQARGEASLRQATTQGRSENGMAYSRSVESDADGRTILEHWRLHGAGHAWSGGDPAGSYTDPRGPDASAEMLRFFLALKP